MNKNYKQFKQATTWYRVFNNSDDAYKALTLSMWRKGWRIGNYNGYENCIWRS